MKSYFKLVLAATFAVMTSSHANAGIFGALVEKAARHAMGATHGSPMEPRVNSGVLGPTGLANCSQLFPGTHPIDVSKIDAQWRPVGLCSRNFAVVVSGLSKSPLIVVEKLNSSMLQDAKGEERTNEFFADPRLRPGERAELSDFRGSSYDRGHMANAADQPDHDSMVQSFALSNMVAQDPVNNRKGAWFKAEVDTRKFAKRAKGNVFVFSGPIFKGPARTIGANKVWIPTHLFKLVYDESSGRAWAHIMPNTADARLEAPISYQAFVQETGWNVLGM